MQPRFRTWAFGAVLALLAGGILSPAFGQFSIITKVTYVPQEIADRLDFRITAPVRVKKEDFPKTHAVLVKILGATFNPEFSEELIRVVKKSVFRPNVAQINGNTIFILFKGMDASRVAVSQKAHLLRIKLQKKSPQAAYRNNLQKGITLVKKKRFRAALLYLRRALRYRAGDPAAYFWAGKARFALGDWEAARFNLQQGSRDAELKAEAKQLLAFIQTKQNEKKDWEKPVTEKQAKEKPAGAILTTHETGGENAPPRAEPKPKPPEKEVPLLAVSTPKGTSEAEAASPQKRQKGSVPYLQLLLFLAIVFTLVALPFIYLLSRRPKKRKKLPGVSFEKNLEAFQIHQQQVIRRVAEAQEPSQPVEERPFRPAPPKWPVEKKSDSNLGWREEPLLRNSYSDSELVRKVKKYASRGYTVDEIAQKLGIGKGELQLAMNLAGEKIELSRAPGLRLTLDDAVQ